MLGSGGAVVRAVRRPSAAAVDDASLGKVVRREFDRDLVTGEREPEWEENVTHLVLLCNGVIMFEYLCNMMAIESERTFFVGLALKIPDSDGAPARAVAIEGL